MKVLSKLTIEEKKTIFFGHPDNPEELEDMFRLRLMIYKKKGYLKEGIKKEIDEYDKNKQKTTYFIAKLDNKVIAHVRLIQEDTLPTEKFFNFENNKQTIAGKKGELSRLVADTKINENKYLPRNIIMLFLIKVLVDYGLQNNITHGYCFIKSNLKKKVDRLKIPIKTIEKYQTVYPSEGILYNYFYGQPEDPVIPIFFITQEIKDYTDDLIQRKDFLCEIRKNEFILKDNIYTRFLKKIKVI